MAKITKTSFLKAYNKFKPNKFILFIFKYFSKPESKDKWLNKIVISILSILFFAGLIGSICKYKQFAIIVTIIFSILLSIVVLSILTAVLMNNFRINKIRKSLGNISKEEYNSLVVKYIE